MPVDNVDNRDFAIGAGQIHHNEMLIKYGKVIFLFFLDALNNAFTWYVAF